MSYAYVAQGVYGSYVVDQNKPSSRVEIVAVEAGGAVTDDDLSDRRRPHSKSVSTECR